MSTPAAPRRALFVGLLVVKTLAIALILLTVFESILAGSLATGFTVAARTLFFFGDIGFYLWLPFLVVACLVLGHRPRATTAFLVLVAGAFLNVVAVTAVGYAQGAGFAPFVATAIEGSTAAVIAAAIAVPVLYRITRWGAVKA